MTDRLAGFAAKPRSYERSYVAAFVRRWVHGKLWLCCGYGIRFKFHPRIRDGFSVLFFLIIASLSVSGQEGNRNIPPGLFPPEMLPQPTYTPEERATIERGLEDMKSADPEIRAGAVMLLAKYEGSLPKDGVVRGLEDASARVRRAAITAILEWNQAVPAGTADKVLLCVGDPDVEVRRAATSALPMMLQARRFAILMSGTGGGPGSMLTPDMEQMMINAFQDEDVQVRRNMVQHMPFLNMPLSLEIWERLLQDEDPMVRLESLGMAVRRIPPEAWLARVRHLAEDENRSIRLRLIRELAGVPSADSASLLDPLVQDSDPEIATEALLLRFRHQPSEEAWRELWSRVEEGQCTSEQSVRVIQSLRMLGEAGFPYLHSATSADSALIRQEAVRLFLMMGLDEVYAGTLEAFLVDPSSEVRRHAINRLILRGDLLENRDYMETLTGSRYSDVKEGLIALADSMPPAVARDVLGDLLLDADNRVRIQALQEYGRLDFPGWKRYASASLRDPDTNVQRAAVGLVLRMEPAERNQVLETFVREYPEAPLSRLIRSHMNQQKANE